MEKKWHLFLVLIVLQAYSYFTSGQKNWQIFSSGQKKWLISLAQNRYRCQYSIFVILTIFELEMINWILIHWFRDIIVGRAKRGQQCTLPDFAYKLLCIREKSHFFCPLEDICHYFCPILFLRYCYYMSGKKKWLFSSVVSM